MTREYTLVGRVEPETDTQALDRETSRMESELDDASSGITPDLDTSGLGSTLKSGLESAIPGAGLVSGLGGGGGDGGGRDRNRRPDRPEREQIGLLTEQVELLEGLRDDIETLGATDSDGDGMLGSAARFGAGGLAAVAGGILAGGAEAAGRWNMMTESPLGTGMFESAFEGDPAGVPGDVIGDLDATGILADQIVPDGNILTPFLTEGLDRGLEGAVELSSDMISGEFQLDDLPFTGALELGQDWFEGDIEMGDWLWSGATDLTDDMFNSIELGDWFWSGDLDLTEDMFNEVELGDWFYTGSIDLVEDMFTELEIGSWMLTGGIELTADLFTGQIDVQEFVAGSVEESFTPGPETPTDTLEDSDAVERNGTTIGNGAANDDRSNGASERRSSRDDYTIDVDVIADGPDMREIDRKIDQAKQDIRREMNSIFD